MPIRYLLDTNHASPLVSLAHPLRNVVMQRIHAGDSFYIATPALAELIFGLSSLPRMRENLMSWVALERDIGIVSLDRDDAHLSAELRIALRQQGVQLGFGDSQIAAIALRYQMTLLSTDIDFDRIPQLRRENWHRPAAN